MTIHTPACFAAHMGPWAIDAQWFTAAVSAVKSGQAKPGAIRGPATIAAGKVVMDPTTPTESQPGGSVPLYSVTDAGVAVVALCGPTMKVDSKYGSANTLRARRALRAIVADADVTSAVMLIDSPGGTVSGTQELADEVTKTDAVKPVLCFIEDQGCSAAYWVAAQGRKVYANAMAQVGSIGVIAVLEDTSKAADMAGVKVHVIATGPLKGTGVDGSPVTDDQLAYVRETVDAMNAAFQSAIKAKRDVKMADVASGRTWMAKQAKALGLIDGIATFDDALAMAAKMGGGPRRRRESAMISLSLED